MGIGLALEGGAMRGMYTAGVLDTFMECDILVDIIAGTSAGALFGVNYLSGQKGRVIRYNKRFNADRKYMGIYPLIKEGNIVSTQYAYYDVPNKYDIFDDETYKKSNIPFYAVVTDINTGKAEYMEIKSVFQDMEVLRASGSMPFLSKPVMLSGREFLDGGISDSIPFRWLAKKGCEKLIVILTRDLDYRKKPMPEMFTKLYYRKYPELVKRILKRHEEYNSAIDVLKQWESQGKVFVIRPSQPIEIGRMEKDPEKLEAVYQLGIKDAKEQLSKLKEYLK